MASIFSVQNLQTFLRRKNLPRPPGPPGRGPRGLSPGPELGLSPGPELGLSPGPEAGRGDSDCWGPSAAAAGFTWVSSAIVFPLLLFLRWGRSKFVAAGVAFPQGLKPHIRYARWTYGLKPVPFRAKAP